jgi:hypothetical protein
MTGSMLEINNRREVDTGTIGLPFYMGYAGRMVS